MRSQAAFNDFCAGLTGATHHLLWGGHDVWKVGDKMFAVAGFDPSEGPRITFKCSDISFEILQEQPGLRKAPYLAARGAPWIQHFEEPGLDDAALQDYLRESHRIVGETLSKRKQKELGLLAD